jgi:hypothetical protein
MRRFEAEFSDFGGDLAAVKACGFKTDGPPMWVWYTQKVTVINKLRENRPASGLTITPDAKAHYTTMAVSEEANAKVKAQAAQIRKEQQKVLKEAEEKSELIIPEKGYIGAEDLPLMPLSEKHYVPPPPPETLCIVCQTPVYFYELQNPPTCLWCEINVLDNSSEI